MDIRCPKCGEPWEIDSIHDEVSARHPEKPWYVETKPENDIYARENRDDGTWYSQKEYDKYFSEVRQEFTLKGCIALGSPCYQENVNPKNAVFGTLMELAGDDIDFAASMIDDAERYGLLD